MHRIRLFGGLSLEGSEGPVSGRATQRRRLALLALVAVDHPRPLSRDKLIGYLWPESDAERARHLLRDSLYLLRGALGDDAILAAGDEVRLNPERLRSDLWEFAGALARGDLEAAAAAYTGPFLDGVFLQGADEFERWAETERGRLARRYAELLETLAERCEAAGDGRGAARWWHRLADQDPYNAGVALRLMAALAAVGDRAGALRHASVHAALMRTAFGVAPDPAVEALAAQIREEPSYRGEVPGEGAGAGEPTPSAAAPPPRGIQASLPVTRSRSPRAPALLALLLLVAVGSGTVLAVRVRAAPSPDPQRVVVVPLENRTGDPALDAVGSIAADWITQGLAASGEVQVVTLTAALTAARHLARIRTPSESLALPRAMAEETGAGIVVLGSYVREGDSLRFQVTITDGISGRVLAAPAPVGAEAAAPIDGIEVLRERVMAELATSLNPRLREHTAAATRPPTYQAYRAYSDGIVRLIEGDWRGALEPLRRGAALDTAFTLPLVVLGMMHFNLGEYAAADSIASIADRSRDRLAVMDRALLDNLRAWLRQDHDAAYRAARAASEVAPGSIATVQMGMEARRLNRPRESIRILTALDPARGELRGDPYYWWDLSLAYHQLGDYRRELRTARRGRVLVPDHPIVRLTEIRALAALGRVAEVERRVDEVLAVPPRESPPPGLLLHHAVLELRAHGRADAARHTAERAVAWHRSRPQEEQSTTGHRRRLAQILYAMGRWEEARSLFEALSLEEPDNIVDQGHLGVIAARQGRRAEAERIAAWLAGVQQPWAWGAPLHWRAAIAAQLGDLDTAVELLREAVARGRLRDGFHVDPALEPLHGHPGFQALLRPRG